VAVSVERELSNPVRRWRHWLIALVVVTCLVIAVGAIARAAARSKPEKPTARELLAACLPSLRDTYPSARVPIAQMHVLLGEGTIERPTVDLSVTPTNLGFYCIDGGEFGPFDLTGGSSEPTNFSHSVGGLQVMNPLWLGDKCPTRTWMLLARAPSDAAVVEAVTNLGTTKFHPYRGLVAMIVHEHITSERPFGPVPFGSLLGFGSRGQLVASANLSPGVLASSKPGFSCPV
jgi:hypothetical protein